MFAAFIDNIGFTSNQLLCYVFMFMLCSYSGSDGNSPKRGYPDVSLLGVHYAVVIGDQTYALDGTSASTPVFAGGIIVSAFSLLSFFFFAIQI